MAKETQQKYRKKHPHQVRMTTEEFTAWKSFKEDTKERNKLLKEEAGAAGIELKDIKHYWYKSDKFSMFAKNSAKTYEELRDDIIAEMDGYSPKYPKVKRKQSKDGHLLVIDIADLHINKHAKEYSTQEAVKRAILGTEGLLQKSSGFNIDKILFVIGNDVLNTDNISKTTTKGTPQDTDVHWYKAFTIAREVYVKCIEMCMQVADVDVVHCPSNHDLMSGCFLADSLNSWFRLSKNVNFFIGPDYRKYYQYHSNMIELEHGDKGKKANLPLLMAQEQPKMWADTKFRYAYLHHVHHSDKTQFQTSKDYIGCNVTYLRSPSSADEWHELQGFINLVAVEAFIHSKELGRVSHLTHYF